ncbi:AMP-binding protein [Hyphomicrobium sp.]|uniref:AMP-binding protein n=1 Tax=Hyphomicrobium sp. TaxID=82 RepID=UPI002FE3F50D
MNPARWLERAALLWPKRPALFRGAEVVLDYAGFNARAGSLAAGLAASGIKPGDRVALYFANRTDYLVAMQAVWRIGAVVVPVNAKLHEKEAAYILGHSGAVLCFTDADHAGDLASLAPEARIIDIDGPAFAALFSDKPAPALHPTGQNDLVWLFYTSGTTGRPKGVMLTPANVQTMIMSYFADVDAAEAGDAKVYAAPMSHGAGLYQFIYLICGARHIVPASGGFDSDEILDLAGKLDNLCFFAAPTMVRRLVAAAKARGHRGEGIRTIVYGGGPMYLADIRDGMEQFGTRFAQIYGQGETPMTITALTRAAHVEALEAGWDDETHSRRLASVGVAQAGCEVAVLGPDEQHLPAGEIGEIAVRGPSVMEGYWNDPAATTVAIREGWLHTGDMGAMDEAGFLTLHDRSKDVIISGGTNIYPREVEEALLTHPAVAQASVVGRPDPEWGEVVVACVVLEHGATAEAAELDAHCLTQIARFKRPKDYVWLDDLPKNAYGKVLKKELRRIRTL